MIDSILQFLKKDFIGDGYYVKEFSSNLYFGKDQNSDFICTRKTNSKIKPFSVKTDCIQLYQNYHFELNVEEEKTADNYDLILLKNEFSNNLKTFVNLCLNFYAADNNKNIIELTEDLIELFKSTRNKNEELEQGLWAELFVIKYLHEKYDTDIFNYWHKDNYMKYDFSLTDNKKLEVKSTIKESRVHKFSHAQVYTKNRVIIASIMMRKDDNGMTVLDMFNQVQEIVKGKYEILSKIQKELFKLDFEKLEKYDLDYSSNKIRFFVNKNIPHFDMDEPEGVFHTQYDIDFENADCTSEEDVVNELNFDNGVEKNDYHEARDNT